MGLLLTDINDFFNEARDGSLAQKSLLMLGNLDIAFSKQVIFLFAKRMGVKIEYERLRNNAGGKCDSRSFFYAIGFNEVRIMDISDYEGADIIFDLNSDNVPDGLCEMFDYIIDGGTTEHVFNYISALHNLSKMLKVDGKIIHNVPANNYINHGYYTISPSLFSDYYNRNGFEIQKIKLEFHPMSTSKNLNDLPAAYNGGVDFLLEQGIDYRMTSIIAGRVDNLNSDFFSLVKCIAIKKKSAIGSFDTGYQSQWYTMNASSSMLAEVLYFDLNIHKGNRIAIYGAGEKARQLCAIFKEYRDMIKSVVCFIKTSVKERESFMDLPVLAVSEVSPDDFQSILISSELYDEEIYAEVHSRFADKTIVRMKEYRHYRMM